MEMKTKATSDGIGYASKSDYEYEGKDYEADLQNNDRVKITGDAVIEEGKFGDQHYFKIETRNGEKKAPFNQSSVNILVGAFGKESKDWVGKEVNILTKKTMIAGEKRIVAYFVVEGWKLDEYGDLVKPENVEDKAKEEVAQYDDGDINPDDIPL